MLTKNTLKLKRLGIASCREHIIFMRADCNICISEGFTLPTRVLVKYQDKEIVATLNIIHSDILSQREVSLSESALQKLQAKEGEEVSVHHLQPIASLSDVRAKIYGNTLNENAFKGIVSDIHKGYYSDIELSAFITACAGDNLNLDEIISLTKAMINIGERMTWNNAIIADKHCVGGLPGNRTTPIVIAIVAAAGITIPKTSSRAITSPAGTADTMEVLTNVNLSLSQIKEVVAKENACLAWGGYAALSPIDDVLIAVEKALDVDSEGQMIASVLSKKAAVGSTHIVIDIPVGKTAKVRTEADALKLQYYFKAVGSALGLEIEVMITDGSQPIGRGIGPSLEAMDLVSVLNNEKDAPQDLKEKSLNVAGQIIELCGEAKKDEGIVLARTILEDGSAWERFRNICHAQGGFNALEYAKYKKDVVATKSGTVVAIDNRRIAKIAKLAGAPESPRAGMVFDAPLGTKIETGQVLFTVYAEAESELAYALEYVNTEKNIIEIN